jgi:hypothetical protein
MKYNQNHRLSKMLPDPSFVNYANVTGSIEDCAIIGKKLCDITPMKLDCVKEREDENLITQ